MVYLLNHLINHEIRRTSKQDNYLIYTLDFMHYFKNAKGRRYTIVFDDIDIHFSKTIYIFTMEAYLPNQHKWFFKSSGTRENHEGFVGKSDTGLQGKVIWSCLFDPDQLDTGSTFNMLQTKKWLS